MKHKKYIINSFGTKRYFNKDGQLHRLNGPAVELADGTKRWYLNGQRHREDGPAIEYANGDKYWFINGKNMTGAEFNKYKK